MENSDGIIIFWTEWCLPMELEIIYDQSDQEVAYHRSPLESIGVGEFRWDQHFLDRVVFTIVAHWSPLDLENSDGINIFSILWCLPLESIFNHHHPNPPSPNQT